METVEDPIGSVSRLWRLPPTALRGVGRQGDGGDGVLEPAVSWKGKSSRVPKPHPENPENPKIFAGKPSRAKAQCPRCGLGDCFGRIHLVYRSSSRSIGSRASLSVSRRSRAREPLLSSLRPVRRRVARDCFAAQRVEPRGAGCRGCDSVRALLVITPNRVHAEEGKHSRDGRLCTPSHGRDGNRGLELALAVNLTFWECNPKGHDTTPVGVQSTRFLLERAAAAHGEWLKLGYSRTPQAPGWSGRKALRDQRDHGQGSGHHNGLR